jgi:hypothetical protein
MVLEPGFGFFVTKCKNVNFFENPRTPGSDLPDQTDSDFGRPTTQSTQLNELRRSRTCKFNPNIERCCRRPLAARQPSGCAILLAFVKWYASEKCLHERTPALRAVGKKWPRRKTGGIVVPLPALSANKCPPRKFNPAKSSTYIRKSPTYTNCAAQGSKGSRRGPDTPPEAKQLKYVELQASPVVVSSGAGAKSNVF